MVLDAKIAAPDVPVVVSVIVFCLPLNVVQSADDKAPRLVPDAVGTFNVITGMVVPFATVLDKSIPLVPNVKADMLVTVGTIISALPSNTIPLIFLGVANFVAVAALPTVAQSVALAIHFQEVPA